MKLFYMPTSPFVRKCIVLAYELGCHQDIEYLDCSANPIHRDQHILVHNPLGQVPTLLTNDAGVLFDSLVICEYLNNRYHGHFFGLAHDTWRIATEHALANGILNAALSLRFETAMRPEALHAQEWIKAFSDKIDTSLDYFEAHIERLDNTITIATITLACALAYLIFRHPSLNWQAKNPNLKQWFSQFKQRPSMQKTQFP